MPGCAAWAMASGMFIHPRTTTSYKGVNPTSTVKAVVNTMRWMVKRRIIL